MSKKTSRDQENVVKKFPHNLKKQNFKTIKPILFLLYTLSLRMSLFSGLKTIFFIQHPFFTLMRMTTLHFTGIPTIKNFYIFSEVDVNKPKTVSLTRVPT